MMDREKYYRALLLELFQTGLRAVSAGVALPSHLPKTLPKGRTLVLGAGKAAAAMAAVTAAHLRGSFNGLVVTPCGHGGDLEAGAIAITEAAHPVPDAHSLLAAERMIALAQNCRPHDRLIFLASGGGSSVLAKPLAGLGMAQKQDIVRHLVHSGADIARINCVRKHLSAIKGGRLAARCGTRDICTFIISDVPGDAPADVASGPTLADNSTCAQAAEILTTWQAPHGRTALAVLARKDAETPKPGSLPGSAAIIACARDCLAAAAATARQKGWAVDVLGDAVQGEARALGEAHGRLALRRLTDGPRIILSGGEVTVTVEQSGGRGGPNQEYLAAMAGVLDGASGIYALACDSDGIDGNGDAAGAFLAPASLARARVHGAELAGALATHNSGAFFAAAGGLIVTGPSQTNVNDFRAILIAPKSA